MSENKKPSQVSQISKKPAKKENISFGNPTILHDSKKQQITMVPFFINRTEENELAIKIITKKKMLPPNEWTIEEEKSVSLKETAARKLLQSLNDHLVIAKEKDNGKFLVIKLDDETADLSGFDQLKVAKSIINLLSKNDILKHLNNLDLGVELISAFKGAIRIKELKTALAELRNYLQDPSQHNEQVYQNWCERHGWVFGNAYAVTDKVRAITTGDNVDFLLPTIIAGYRDLFELKRPNMDVLHYDSSHKNYYFSSEVSKALGQCHRYLDLLHEVAGKGLLDHQEIVAYHPKATIVIGRSNDWVQDQLRALHGLNRRMNMINVITYDQLLAQGERLINILEEHPQQAEEEV